MSQQLFRGIAERAMSMIIDGSILGLGTGQAASAFIRILGEHVGRGLRVQGVPTSQASADLAGSLNIPLTTLERIEAIDLTVDGADEVDPNCNLIKGYGGALVREKIVAAASKKRVILVGPEKLVPALGARGKLPVEVVPFALPFCRRRIEALGCAPLLRRKDDAPFTSDNGNHILDCSISVLIHPAELERELRSIPGVVGTGLFLGMADVVLIQQGDTVETRTRQS